MRAWLLPRPGSWRDVVPQRAARGRRRWRLRPTALILSPAGLAALEEDDWRAAKHSKWCQLAFPSSSQFAIGGEREGERASAHADELIGLLPLFRRQRLVKGIEGRLNLLHRGEMLFHHLQVQVNPLRQS